MTTTIDTETSWPKPVGPDPNLDGIHVLTHKNNDYLRRIHWWVRLFGIVWIVIPIVATAMFVAFVMGIIGMAATDSDSYSPTSTTSASSYSSCMARGYSSVTCRALYSD